MWWLLKARQGEEGYNLGHDKPLGYQPYKGRVLLQQVAHHEEPSDEIGGCRCYGKNTGHGPVWSGEGCKTRAASFNGHNSKNLRGWSQSKPDVAVTEKPYLQRNNEAIWGIGAGWGGGNGRVA